MTLYLWVARKSKVFTCGKGQNQVSSQFGKSWQCLKFLFLQYAVLINYKSYLISIFVSLAISIGLQMILPFPFGLIAALAVFAAYPLILRNRAMRKMGGTGSMGGGGLFGQGQSFKYVCLACGNRFKGAICPRCGSKMKRADF